MNSGSCFWYIVHLVRLVFLSHCSLANFVTSCRHHLHGLCLYIFDIDWFFARIKLIRLDVGIPREICGTHTDGMCLHSKGSQISPQHHFLSSVLFKGWWQPYSISCNWSKSTNHQWKWFNFADEPAQGSVDWDRDCLISVRPNCGPSDWIVVCGTFHTCYLGSDHTENYSEPQHSNPEDKPKDCIRQVNGLHSL